ncbi:hypothetical protein RintRC_2137 [Richelia intracellularis]|nr:hypothetical protein RintRC_2137 [Richelia intracellularis]
MIWKLSRSIIQDWNFAIYFYFISETVCIISGYVEKTCVSK